MRNLETIIKILDPDKRNFEVVKFNCLEKDVFHGIIKMLHVSDIQARVITHIHFIRRKKGQHILESKSTVTNA